MTNKEAAVLLVQEYANYKQAVGTYVHVHVQLAEAVAMAVIALGKASTDEEEGDISND